MDKQSDWRNCRLDIVIGNSLQHPLKLEDPYGNREGRSYLK
ncbi:MAG: hypothetical protein AAE977_02000 [Thermoplasmataceae archaeon]